MDFINLKKCLMVTIFAASLLTYHPSHSVELITNGSFETGDFTGWETKDITSPFFTLNIRQAGTSPGFGSFTVAPTDGMFVASHGFDGGGPDTIEISQEVIIPNGFDASLTFDWRAGWDYFTFGAISRTFDLVIEDTNSDTIIFQQNLLTADYFVNQALLDTGPNSELIDLSSFAGNSIRIIFTAYIPQYFTGPAHMQLDNVSLDIIRRDSDLDGVLDTDDLCPNTLIPESSAKNGLLPNKHALLDNDGSFDTQLPYGGGSGSGNSYTTTDTKGCSCEQIVTSMELGKGHSKHGCSTGVMDKFIKNN